MLRDGGRTQALEIAPNAVLLLNGKLVASKALEEEDDVDRGDKACVGLFTVYAGNDAVGVTVIVYLDGFARDDEAAAVLDLCKADKAAADTDLCRAPVGAYIMQRGDKVENRRLYISIPAALSVLRAYHRFSLGAAVKRGVMRFRRGGRA